MDWAYILIILIPLLVWVLSTIFRGQDEPKPAPRRAPPGDGAPLATPRRAVTDLDRFLLDAQRRREKAAERQAEAGAEVPILALEVPEPPPPPPPPPAPKAPEPRPRKDAAPPRRDRPAVEKRAVPFVATPAPAAPAPLQAPPATSPAPRPAAPPVLTRLMAMLRDRDALKAGLVLREVLDRPLSQRRGPRGGS